MDFLLPRLAFKSLHLESQERSQMQCSIQKEVVFGNDSKSLGDFISADGSRMDLGAGDVFD